MISDIHLQNFRSYGDESFEFSPDINIIVGPNASGKTNLLESLLVVSRGGSYRAKDIELIEFKKDWARIQANTEKFNRVVKISKADLDKTAKDFEINSKKLKRLNLDQTIPVVLFEPNHLLLLIGSPELRRSYIDDILDQTITGYKTLKNQYRRALSQRNFLLKKSSKNSSELFVWNVRLSELGGRIFKERVNLIAKLNQDVDKLYDSLSSGSETINLIYKTNLNTTSYETNLLHKLEQSSDIDMARGFTAHGPHRDDLQIIIDGKPASEVASRGETRTILLALKVIETKVIEAIREQKPILLFDDVFSELDGARRLALTTILNGYQAFITTTDADIVIQHFTQTANIIPTQSRQKPKAGR